MIGLDSESTKRQEIETNNLTAHWFNRARRLLLAVILLGAFGLAVFGQQVCPKIELILPQGIIEIETPTTVVARLSGGFDYKLSTIKWLISSGKIVDGQGTAAVIFVPSEDDAGINIKVTLVVSGLSETCNSSVSNTVSVATMPIGEPADRFGKEGFWDLRGKLDVYMAVVRDSPTYEGFITVEFNRKDKREYKIKRLKQIYSQFVFRKFDLTRITIAVSEGDYPETLTLWTMHPGAKVPKYARGFRLIKAEEFSKAIKNVFT